MSFTKPPVDGGPATEPIAAPVSRVPAVVRRFLGRKISVISLAVFVAILLFAFVGPHFWKYSFDVYTPDNSQPPSLNHPFGTDSTGYDTLAQVMRGTQRSVQIALFVALVATAVGSVIGAVSGYYGKIVDAVTMRFVDLVLMFPSIAVAAVLAHQSLGSKTTWLTIGLVLALLAWPIVARLVRSTALQLAKQEFVLAARGAGASDLSIIVRHIIPNSMGTITVAVTVLTATAILSETSLSYLGFGVQPPDTSLGLLVAGAQSAVVTRPWIFYFPGIFIILVALTASFIGDGLRAALDPRQGSGGQN
ncbi:ABC transporter permease [Spelaeicoccus albus]|uniref:Oligopeptide transport system permease protein OppC n=1 Tax=Spelaeicoccus albus TaxID=1280376 RepID=A0A7Z0D1H9_9MICO|nr:ABC transporter permease [Spelaeicoccus albus]NYI67058.1 peptide/nickel transport system permease protein [Spelaeicoccus albus]